ncbi:metal ABC transporter solute-binding protein, Zn/Mn family [Limnoraphis robusta]|uniref:Zinc ABC transporter substrate-binding protein n=1 Tax=Limnoraphis robusta CCNP1315 TaxID=3110306 RepID=A0ABU5TXC8_9CYAN|nr:zinc ABC transporter substrate-binding protein [Limnoraphis robusta]MEA5501406.1 zinc ABC transporter substrate-binding protein [Limnoraphis robusta BA-68 BA1]MEA5519592.1 zinc ABC transporter substrate-binding protein [Limnoraphis robusta CCNP1315]MEA5549270.1 zinc ABC transporter substrate-binding protein [Limnoraphis robusta CCNP1324]
MSPSQLFRILTHPSSWKRRPLFAVLLISAIAVSIGSLTTVAQNTRSTKVVATFLPMYLFTKAVSGSSREVEILVPPNVTAHEYQASPSDARKLAQAQILVKNGLGMETFLSGLVANAGNPQLKQIDASQGIQALQEDHDHDHGHSHAEGNPHVWLDPILAQKQVANIREGLIAADAGNAQTYRANADAYIKQLQQLDQEFKSRLGSVKGCKFIAFHDAYPYLARRYGIQQMAVLELPEDSISPRDIQRVIAAVKEYDVQALLSEPGVNDSRLQQISNDVGLPVKTLDPIETGSLDPQYYFTAMRKNLKTLEDICK